MHECETHRLLYSAFIESEFFLYFLFLTKNRWSNRLNQKLLWMRRKRICVNSCTYAWKWEERDRNSGSGKVQEIVLFRCYFHGNWAPRVGPPGSQSLFDVSIHGALWSTEKSRKRANYQTSIASERTTERLVHYFEASWEIKRYKQCTMI